MRGRHQGHGDMGILDYARCVHELDRPNTTGYMISTRAGARVNVCVFTMQRVHI